MQTVKIIRDRTVRWLDEGRWRQLTCPTPAEASALAARIAAGQVPRSLADLFDQYLRVRGLTGSTVRQYRCAWGRVPAELLRLPADRIGPEQLAGAVADLPAKRRNYLLAILRAVFALGRDLGWCGQNPARLITFGREDQTHRMLVGAQAYQAVRSVAGPRLAAAMALGRYAGLRAGECLHLPWSHIDLAGGQLVVAAADGWSTKSGRRRTVPLGPETRAALHRIAGITGRYPGVLDTPAGAWKSLYARLDQAKGRCGLPDDQRAWRFHDLRRTWLTELANGGMPPVQLAALAGHRDINVTMTYYTVADAAAIAAALRRSQTA